LRRVEAHGEEVVIAAEAPIDAPRGLHDAVQHQGAEHRALVIDEREQDGAAAMEEVAELHRAAVLVLEREVERDTLAEPLDDVHALERRRELRRRDRAFGARGAAPDEDQRGDGDRPAAAHQRAPSTMRCIACSIGMWMIPFGRSTQPYSWRRASCSPR